MDYGQTTQQDGNQPFFTEGVGSQSVEYTDAPEDNINLSNTATSWGERVLSRDQNQNFGHSAINGQLVENPNADMGNFEAYAPAPDIPAPDMGPDFGPATEPLGEIIDTEPAPTPTDNANASTNYAYDQSAIRVEGDSLNSKAVDIISDMEKTLGKTGDAAGFFESFENAKVDNLKNSYNRIFGES